MKALTVRQPWAGLIARGTKDVENRTWEPTIAIGERFAIHAGRMDPNVDVEWWDPADELCHVRGLVIATVRLVDVVRDSRSEWARPGHWHWVLEDPRRTRRPVRVRGALGLWDIG